METIYSLLSIGFKLTGSILSILIYFSLVYLLAKELRDYVTKNYRTFLTLTNTRFINLSYCDIIFYACSFVSLAIITEMYYTHKISLLLTFLNILLMTIILICFEIKYPRKLKTVRVIK